MPAARGATINVDPEWDAVLTDLAERWRARVPLRKQDRSRRRESEIVQAALRVFARDGIARARISDVAAEAGMPVSSIYEYCPSKDDLAYAVPLRKIGEFFIAYSEHARAAGTARERLTLYLQMSVDFARQNPDWARTLYLEVWPSVQVADSPVREGLDAYAKIIIDLLRDGEAAGEWSGGSDPYETATILIGSSNQLIITWLMYRRPRDVSRAAGALLARLLSGLLPAPQAGAVAASEPVRSGPPASGRNSGRAKAAGGKPVGGKAVIAKPAGAKSDALTSKRVGIAGG